MIIATIDGGRYNINDGDSTVAELVDFFLEDEWDGSPYHWIACGGYIVAADQHCLEDAILHVWQEIAEFGP